MTRAEDRARHSADGEDALPITDRMPALRSPGGHAGIQIDGWNLRPVTLIFTRGASGGCYV